MKRPSKNLSTETDLKKYLPNSPSSTGYSVIDLPFIKPDKIDEDNEDLEDDVDALAKECLSLVTASHTSPSPQAEVVTPTKLPAKSSSTDKNEKAVAQSKKDAQVNQLAALGATYKPTSRKISPPTISTFS